jgi:hypothetical protein
MDWYGKILNSSLLEDQRHREGGSGADEFVVALGSA